MRLHCTAIWIPLFSVLYFEHVLTHVQGKRSHVWVQYVQMVNADVWGNNFPPDSFTPIRQHNYIMHTHTHTVQYSHPQSLKHACIIFKWQSECATKITWDITALTDESVISVLINVRSNNKEHYLLLFFCLPEISFHTEDLETVAAAAWLYLCMWLDGFAVWRPQPTNS